MKKKIIALIGIRAGSKSLKNKNIHKFRNKPLVYWIIQAAKQSKLIDRIIVSTDSDKYRKLCLSFGVEVPFLRPKRISGGRALEIDYILHCLNWLKKNENYVPDFVTRLQATSPLQLTGDIDNSINVLIRNKKATSSMVVAESVQSPDKAMKYQINGKYLRPYIGNSNIPQVVNRQKLVTSYHRANIITTPTKQLLKHNEQVGNKSIAIEIPQIRSIDINNELDLFIAEQIANKYKLCSD